MLTSKRIDKLVNTFKTNKEFRQNLLFITYPYRTGYFQYVKNLFPEIDISYNNYYYFVLSLNNINHFNLDYFDNREEKEFIKAGIRLGLNGLIKQIHGSDWMSVFSLSNTMLFGWEEFLTNWKSDIKLSKVANCDHYWDVECDGCKITSASFYGLRMITSPSYLKGEKYELIHLVSKDKVQTSKV